MTKLLTCVLFFLLPLVNGSSLLKVKEGGAYCTGNLTDLELISATCPYESSGCTWGSAISVYAQVNATQDFPRQTHVVLTPSIPHFSAGYLGLGTLEATEYSSQYCNSILQAPAGADAGYSCPDAGEYNVRLTFPLFGESLAWYANMYGFNVGVNVKFTDAETGDAYAYCYAEVKVKNGNGVSSSWGFLLGGAGLLTAIGYVYQKRRVATAALSEEMTTNFELVNDQIMHV